VPVLLDSRSPTGQAELERQQQMMSVLTLGSNIFIAMIQAEVSRGVIIQRDELVPLAQAAIVASGVYHQVGKAWHEAETQAKVVAQPEAK
jgi:hypothetical protein